MMHLIFAIIGISSMVYASENCLNLLYNERLFQRDSVQIDSVYFLEGINDWSHKYHNTAGVYDSMTYDKLDGSPIRTMKFMGNESELTSIGYETILLRSSSNDTIIEIMNDYYEGQLSVTRKTNWTKDTIEYSETSSGLYGSKTFMNLDTLIEIYFVNSVPTDTTYFVQSTPEICIEYNSQLNEAGRFEFSFDGNGYTEEYIDGDYSRTTFYKYSLDNVGIVKSMNVRKAQKNNMHFDLIGRIKSGS